MVHVRGRPPLSVGTYGQITIKSTSAGTFQAMCRYRDMDGRTRKVTATGRTKREATDTLTSKLRERSRGHDDVLTARSTVADLARVWISKHEASPGALEQYQGTIDRHIVPKVGALLIRELTPARADRFIEDVSKKHAGAQTKSDGTPIMIGGATAAKSARVVLTQMFSMAVRYELCETNPVREVRTPKVPKSRVRALTTEELHDLIDDVREWATSGTYGPARDQDVLDMIDALVGTGVRPGEVLALRWSDGVQLGEIPTVKITGTAKRTKSRGLHRQDYPKTEESERVLRIPDFMASMLRRRKLRSGGNDYVFPNRDGGLREPANFNRLWRQVRGEKWAWVTPKSFRAAVATIIDREADSSSAASQLGHTTDAVTRRHYIERDRTATDNSEILQRFRDAQ